MRLAVLLLCLPLAACGGLLTADSTDPAAPAAEPPKPGTASAPPPAQRRRPAQALRGSTTYLPPADAAMPMEDPVLKIRAACWAEGDRNKSLRSLDARADWVNKCIADRTKAQAGQ